MVVYEWENANSQKSLQFVSRIRSDGKRSPGEHLAKDGTRHP